LKVRICFHDKCFDGASSAALFSRFYRERIREDATFVFSGLLHRAGSLFDESHFDGDENAVDRKVVERASHHVPQPDRGDAERRRFSQNGLDGGVPANRDVVTGG